jgi:N-methylhydantoinase A
VQGDLIAPVYRLLSTLSKNELDATRRQLEEKAQAWLDEELVALPIEGSSLSFAADMRYEGQGYDLTVSIEREALLKGDLTALARTFTDAYRAVYGHANNQAEIWIKELRLRIVGRMPRPNFARATRGAGATASGRRQLRVNGQQHEAQTYDRTALGAGDRIRGPAIVDQLDTTLLIPPRWEAEVLESGAILMNFSG